MKIVNRYNNPQYREDVEADKDKIIELYNDGYSVKEIAKKYNIGERTLRTRMNRWGISFSNNNNFRGKNSHWTGYGNIPGEFIGKTKRSAKRREIYFNITAKEVDEIYIKQNKKCALSGIVLKFDSYSNLRDGNVSLDRIDSLKGYTKENCQLVTKTVNNMKSQDSNAELIYECEQIADYNRPKQYKDII